MGINELMIVWALVFGGMSAPVGLVPGEEAPYLSQIAPDDCFIYFSWSGSVPADPEKNVTEKWIAQEGIQTFWEKLYGELDRFADKEIDDDPFNEVRPILLKLAKISLSQPGAMVVNRASEDGMSGNVVFKLGKWEEEIAAGLKNINGEVLAEKGWERETQHGMEVIVFKQIETFPANLVVKAGIHNGYLMVAFSGGDEQPSFDKIFASEKTPEPKWLTEIKNELPIERRGSIAMIDVEKFVKLAEGLPDGLEFNPIVGAKKIGSVTGFDGDGYLSRTWIQTEGELGVFFKAFEGEPLGAEELQDIPSNQMISVVSRLSPEQIYSGLEAVAESTGDQAEFDGMGESFENFSGMRLKEDFLDKLDDYVLLYTDLEMEKIMGGNLPYLFWVKR